MLKAEKTKVTIEGKGEDILTEFVLMTRSMKSVILNSLGEKDENFSDFLLFDAFRKGLTMKDTGKAKETAPTGRHEKAAAPKKKAADPVLEAVDRLIAALNMEED